MGGFFSFKKVYIVYFLVAVNIFCIYNVFNHAYKQHANLPSSKRVHGAVVIRDGGERTGSKLARKEPVVAKVREVHEEIHVASR